MPADMSGSVIETLGKRKGTMVDMAPHGSQTKMIFEKDLHFKKVFRYLSKYINMNKLFKALNDETRRDIIEMLKERDMNAGEIAEAFNISKPSISHHLDILKQADLITVEKKGQFMEYSLNATILEELLSWILTIKK